jgi:DNA invertase Pin-like site-specific DNA recombinase
MGEPKAPRKARFVGYVRVSKDEQEISFSAQEAALYDWCTDMGAELVVVHKERLSSAKPLKLRPAINLAVQAVAEWRADGLLVYRRDRAARNAFEARVIERALQKVPTAKAPWVWAVQGNNDDTAEGSLVRGIVDLVAEYEGRLTRARTKRVLDYKRSQGLPTGRIPFGQRRADDGTLAPHLEEQATIARARALRAAGHAQTYIAQQLNHEGRPARGRKNQPTTWTQSMVSRLLRREESGDRKDLQRDDVPGAQ